MSAYFLPLDPPEDNIEKIEKIMQDAFETFLRKGYNKGIFCDLYDLVFEEIENNLVKYLPELEYDFGN